MGILNVTPDSFSDGGRYADPDAAVRRGLELWRQGADLVDVGGESTRPGADPVDAVEELRRVEPVVAQLAAAGVVVSIDTGKASVARGALEAGALAVNDVTGLSDPDMVATVCEAGSSLVVMHMPGDPRTMHLAADYADVVREVRQHLMSRARAAIAAGVEPERICIDPGIGFGKTLDHNLELLARLGEIASCGFPVMVGTSRKSFLGRLLDLPDPQERDLATAITVALAAERGAAVVRVHDVPSARQAAALVFAMVPHGEDSG
jgi:dihydropteroate synthase